MTKLSNIFDLFMSEYVYVSAQRAETISLSMLKLEIVKELSICKWQDCFTFPNG